MPLQMKTGIKITSIFTGLLALFAGLQGHAQLSVSYSPSSQSYSTGSTISTLSPTVDGGTASAGGQTTTTFVSSGLYNPLNTAVDAAGNVYIADSDHNQIQKVTPLGTVTTLAGSGSAGSTDGTGTGASFQHPSALAVDASGNVFVSDQQNHRIRKITPSGVVSTFAGSGSPGFANGTGTSASFYSPIGLAFDASGNLYVADYSNHRIRVISPAGVVSTFAGTGNAGSGNGSALSASFRNPMGVAVDASGNVFVADRLNHMIRKISGGAVSTVAGNGSMGSANGYGTSATFQYPNNLAIDASGNIYVADQQNHTIRRIDASGYVSAFAGTTSAGTVNGTGSGVRLNSPYGLSIDRQGTLYVAETGSFYIRKIVTAAFVIAPQLPSGLSFNNSNGNISGTPTVASAAANYYITAYNTTNSSSAFALNITVTGVGAVAIQPSNSQNYVVETIVRQEGITSVAQVSGLSVAQANRTIRYLDGLGRPSQSIQVQASPTGKDIVQPISYDAYGREAIRYQPYATQTGNNGAYKTDAFTQQSGYYSNTSGWDMNVVKTPVPYSVTVFEPSPLNRVDQQGAPGVVWQPGTGRAVVSERGTNTAGDVRKWTVSGTGASSTNSFYDVGTLYRKTIKDENWTQGVGKAGTTDEYRDLQGRVVLKRNWETVTKSLSTYYLYDDLGNLRYVLPPAVNENTERQPGTIDNFTEADDVFKDFIYGYHYDSRNRVTGKKIPGKDWEYLVYNTLDQVVLSQDWNQRNAGQWLFTKYDAFGHVVVTGLYTDGRSPGDMQVYVDGLLNDNTYQLWEVRSNDNGSGTYTGYSNNAFPKSVAYYHGINYYDDYDFFNNTFGTPVLPQVGNDRTKSLLTGTRTTILGTGTMLLSVNYYDADGRIIQTKSENHLNGVNAGTDVVDNDWNFDGSLNKSTRVHVANGVATTIANTYGYDHIGRKKSVKLQINGGTLVTLSSLTYNEIGQLIDKAQHSTDDVNFAQHTAYSYNERGWLTSQGSSLFSFTLGYNSGSAPQYNGNISTQTYTNGGSSNTFNYSYDRLNRLTASAAGNSLGESISYDVMGNIKTLYRDGSGTNDYHIDQYKGNQLKAISGFTSGSYIYNENGNLISDGPNGNAISYNYLNLPLQVSGSQNVSYTYDATGKKLKKVSATMGTTDYLDGIVYKPSGVIDFIQTEEGLARNSNGTYSYEYNLADHLGNVRVSFQKNPLSGVVEPIQRDDYYAFGLRKVATGGTNKYLYNGKELQEELGQYDYGARFYDPVIGRWGAIDPMSEKYVELSSYAYCKDNPIGFFDFEGGDPTPAQYREFFLNYAISLYERAKNQGASVKGAITLVSQIALESAYATNSGARNYNNPYSIMYGGKMIKFDDYNGSTAAYFKNLDKHWPDLIPTISKSNFSADQLDRALHTGDYESQGGAYMVRDEVNNYDYGEKILGANSSITRRFSAALDQGITDNNNVIKTEGDNLMQGLKDLGKALSTGDTKAYNAAQAAIGASLSKSNAAQAQNDLYRRIRSELNTL